MYTRTTADELALTAAGFEELDAHWFRYKNTDMYIQMPNNPLLAEPDTSDTWEVFADFTQDVCLFVTGYPTLAEAIACCVDNAKEVEY